MDVQLLRSAAASVGLTTVGALAFTTDLLHRPLPKRVDFVPKGVLLAVAPYYAGGQPGEISLYARGKDYHAVLPPLLERWAALLDVNGIAFTDASPLREVYAAALAGLGVVGENHLLITPNYGSYVFLGAFLTKEEVPVTGDGAVHRCIGCGRCQAACPGGALTKNGVDAARCLSAISQKKGELTSEEETLLKSTHTGWGCDRCQWVCPMNAGVEETHIPAFRENLLERLPALTGEDPLLPYADRAFAWRGPEPLKRNYRLLHGDLARD